MADQGYQPNPAGLPASAPDPAASPGMPGAPAPTVPAGPAVYAGVPGAYPAAPPRRRGWIGWLIAGFVLLLVAGLCAAPVLWLVNSGVNASGPTTFGDAVAVIKLDGVISGTGDTLNGTVTPESFRDDLQLALDDPNVKAIVVRIDSPGGTVAASEEISAYIKDSDKPMIASVGDIGASGAYMAASQCDEIWAMPGSSVGSIGVIAEIPNASKLLDKVGIEFQTITAGKNKDAGSAWRPLTKEERQLVQEDVNEAYEQFIGIVAEGRKMKPAEVRKLATGWVWSGAKAKRLGLVDSLGTFDQALDAAAKAGGIDTEDYEVVTYDEQFEDILGPLLGLNSTLRGLSGTIDPAAAARRSLPR